MNAARATAIEGAEAALKGERFQLVILDVMMPRENSLALRRHIRKQRSPVILVSARGEDVDRVIGLENGAAQPSRCDGVHAL